MAATILETRAATPSALRIDTSAGGSVALDQALERACKILHGTGGYYALCWCSAGASFSLAAYCFQTMSVDNCTRALAFQSFLFLFAQSFTIAKTNRDSIVSQISHISRAGVTSQEHTIVLNFLRPTPDSVIQAGLFFFVSLAFAIYAVSRSDLESDYIAFNSLIMLWAPVSAISLSKVARDRYDAILWRSAWSAFPHETQVLYLHYICELAVGSILYRLLVWASAVCSVFVTLLYLLLGVDNKMMSLEAKGFFAVCLLFCIFAAFMLAKVVRDLDDPLRRADLADQKPYVGLVIFAFVFSSVLVFTGVGSMDMPASARLFVLAGSTFSVMSAMCLAKCVRDKLEVKRLREGRVLKWASPGATAPPALEVKPDVP